MGYFAVIDTETNWNDQGMSIGIVIAETQTFRLIDKKYYVIDPAYQVGGMFSGTLNLRGPRTILCQREKALAGIVTLIAEIWDAISDPLMGILGDNTRPRMGRRRPYILASGCLLSVAFALIFMPITELTQTWKFIYCAATYLFYNTVSTMFNVSYSSMSAEISEISAERDSANVLRLVVSTVGAAVCTLLPSIVLDAYKDGKIDVQGLT